MCLYLSSIIKNINFSTIIYTNNNNNNNNNNDIITKENIFSICFNSSLSDLIMMKLQIE